MHVDKYRPPPAHPLHPYVQAIFRIRLARPYARETILPKGNVDLLFNLGGPLVGAATAEEGSVWVGGLRTGPYQVRATGAMDLLGVSLHAEGAAALVPLPAGELLNREAHGAEAVPGLESLCDALREAAVFDAQRTLLVAWLLARLRPPRGAALVAQACARLRESRAADPFRETASALAISPRHLRRLITQQVGVSPGEYLRLSRFIRSLHRLHAPHATIGRVAHAAGYYDHAHFCHDFRAIAGMTPQEYRAQPVRPAVGHVMGEGAPDAGREGASSPGDGARPG
ncbi:MAG TPA: AraC family transcriptional regulator [Longimicrobium sp.]|jgi:AraC-like DNA-binding protein